MPVRHPGGALGYRFSASTGSEGPAAGARTAHHGLVYISDNELNPAAPYESPASWRRELIRFIEHARILVHDTMFTAEEYGHHQGWGHSTYEDAVDLALEAGVDMLVLFHHKPERSDEEVDRHTDACRALVHRRGGTLEIVAAAEGLVLQA
jgi:phosphoribosyl 1,2-cyclic phosphodiesterase